MYAPKLAIVLLSSLTALSMGPLVNAATDSITSPEAIVQAQLEAYNARDLEAFVATYADNVQIFEHPAKLLAAGPAQLRERYAARFKEPNLHAVIARRIVMGNTVIDHELITRTYPEGPGTLEAIAIYEVQDGKIAKVWLVLGPKTLGTK
jgi:putative hydrolase of HD superfamily